MQQSQVFLQRGSINLLKIRTFRESFKVADAKFRENKLLIKLRNYLLMSVTHALVAIFNVAYMSINAICENIPNLQLSRFSSSALYIFHHQR